MGIYVGLLLVTLAFAYLAVKISQIRTAGNGLDPKGARSQIAWRRTDRNKQKGTIGVRTKSKASAKTTSRPAFVEGANHKPWGW